MLKGSIPRINEKLNTSRSINETAAPIDKKGPKGIDSFIPILPNFTKVSPIINPNVEAINIAAIHPFSPSTSAMRAESFASPRPIFPPEKNQRMNMNTNPITPENKRIKILSFNKRPLVKNRINPV